MIEITAEEFYDKARYDDEQEEKNMIFEKRKQVTDQCRVVVHLATALAQIYSDYVKILEAGGLNEIVNEIGLNTANYMEVLGNILSNMDAVEEEDEWTDPIFEKAHKMFPVKEEPLQ